MWGDSNVMLSRLPIQACGQFLQVVQCLWISLRSIQVGYDFMHFILLFLASVPLSLLHQQKVTVATVKFGDGVC